MKYTSVCDDIFSLYNLIGQAKIIFINAHVCGDSSLQNTPQQ